MSHSVVLISCCNKKVAGGTQSCPFSDSILSTLSEKTQKKLLGKRQQMYHWIKTGMIEDKLRDDGNRIDNTFNRILQNGPDVSEGVDGEDSTLPLYLPAYQRYRLGRFFDSAGADSFEQAIFKKDCHTLIVSGLYGLIMLEEPIQLYSCHLDDEIIPEKRGELSSSGSVKRNCSRVSEFWKEGELLDETLKEYILHHNQRHDHKIKYIIDLLSESSYQNVFRWDSLSGWCKKNSIIRFHRVVYNVKEPVFLSDLGNYYRYDLIENDGYSREQPKGKIVREYLNTINRNEGTLIFSSKVEPDPYYAGRLRKELGDRVWENLDDASRFDLIQGEKFWDLYEARSNRDDEERTPRIVNLFSALENELRLICGVKPNDVKTMHNLRAILCEKDKKHLIPDEHERESIDGQLARVARIRNNVSHPLSTTRRELLEARSIILGRNGLLAKLIRIKIGGNWSSI